MLICYYACSLTYLVRRRYVYFASVHNKHNLTYNMYSMTIDRKFSDVTASYLYD